MRTCESHAARGRLRPSAAPHLHAQLAELRAQRVALGARKVGAARGCVGRRGSGRRRATRGLGLALRLRGALRERRALGRALGHLQQGQGSHMAEVQRRCAPGHALRMR